MEKVELKSEPRWVGTFVVYLNVGTMTNAKVEEYVTKTKEKFQEWIEICKGRGYCVLIIPTRETETHIEQFDFAPDRIEKLEDIKLQLLANNPELLS